MKRAFIELPLFRAKWESLGLNDKSNLTKDERNELKRLVAIIERQLEESE